jgi:hypothetical protein
MAANLREAFGVDLIRRQQPLKDDFADILGVSPDGAAVLIEVKVVEERHVLGQILRYRHRLLELKPHSDRIDHSKSARLLIVAPFISEQTLIEHAVCSVPVELWHFELKRRGERLDLRLKRVDLPDQPAFDLATPLAPPLVETVAPVPEKLERWLASVSIPHGEGIRRFREILLAGGEKEFVEPACIFYGAKKSAPSAEIRFEKKRNRPVLFTWLGKFPLFLTRTENPLSRISVVRTRLWSDDDANLTHLHHVADGFGKMKTPKEWIADADAEVARLPDGGNEFKKSRIRQLAREKSGTSSIHHTSKVPLQVETYLKCDWRSEQRFRGRKALPFFPYPLDRPDYWPVIARLALLWAHRKRRSG